MPVSLKSSIVSCGIWRSSAVCAARSRRAGIIPSARLMISSRVGAEAAMSVTLTVLSWSGPAGYGANHNVSTRDARSIAVRPGVGACRRHQRRHRAPLGVEARAVREESTVDGEHLAGDE